ncbi:MAG: PAS domain-containing sensor histidine kinase [Bacteroidota bacterium]
MESKEGSDALFLYATEGILIADAQGEIVRVNPSATRLFGYEKDELSGKKIEVLIPSRFSHAHVGHREGYSHHPRARSMGSGMELYGLKKDGSEFPLEISLSPYHNEAGSFVIAFIIDATLRKQSEENLKHYSADLEKQVKDRTLVFREAIKELKKTKSELYDALEKERELNEMKSRFVSLASHEFRTPLTTMLSSLSLIALYHERSDNVNFSKHIEKVENSIGDLTEILNDFLSVSQLEEGKLDNVSESFNLNLFVEDIVSEMRAVTIASHNLVHTHTGAEMALLDPKLLKNILFNLISNALKFSPKGGTIEVLTDISDEEIRITVSDQGIGISATDQAHLFERFFRGHNATHIQGTGLGLHIVGSYIKLMQGQVQIESKENEGTRVIILFPTNY